MENSQLPRVQSTSVQPAAAAQPDQTRLQGEGGEFDDYLHQQIEQNAPVNQGQAEKPVSNQEDSQDLVGMEESLDGLPVTEELNLEALPPGELEVELEPTVMAQVDAQGPALSAITGASGAPIQPTVNEQLMPPTGNGLPPVASATELAVDEVLNVPASRQAQAAVSLATVSRQGIQPEPLSTRVDGADDIKLADVLEESASTANRLKPNLMADVSTQTGLPKIGVQIASAITAASLQQQVPMTTTASAVNLAMTAPPAEGGLNSLTSMTGSINMPVQSSSWSQGVTEQVAYMVQGRFQSAELRLNPANLGPMQIKMNLQDDQASVTFISAHAPVREALDAALPRLREMFEQQGLNLADVDVSQYSEGQGNQAEQDDGAMMSHAGSQAEESPSMIHEARVAVALDDGVSIYA